MWHIYNGLGRKKSCLVIVFYRKENLWDRDYSLMLMCFLILWLQEMLMDRIKYNSTSRGILFAQGKEKITSLIRRRLVTQVHITLLFAEDHKDLTKQMI